MSERDGWAIEKESPLGQAKAVAQEMAAGRLGLIEGVRRLVDLRHALFHHGADDADFQVIMDFDRETVELPVGAARQYWAPAVLAEKDREIAALELKARDRVMAAVAASIEAVQAQSTAARRQNWWRRWLPF